MSDKMKIEKEYMISSCPTPSHFVYITRDNNKKVLGLDIHHIFFLDGNSNIP